MNETFNVYIKKEDASDYDTIDTSNVYHAGDSIWIDGERWVVIGGKVLPQKG